MLQARGSAPHDSYRVLQLQPTAPRALVVETYWMLVEDGRGRSDSTRLDALLLAFETLSCEELRRPSLAKARPAPGDPIDYYSRLHVDRCASTRVIELAHDVLTRGRIPSRQRKLLDAAYQTLSNGYRRAAYDSSIPAPTHEVIAEERGVGVAVVEGYAHRAIRPFELRIRRIDSGESPDGIGGESDAASRAAIASAF